MKRLLSLLVVIAMVVSMIPSVFAAKEEVDMDELLGRLVVLEDIEGFSISIAEGSDGMIYQWTPAEDELAEALRLSWYPETADLTVTATTGDTTVTATTEFVESYGYGELVLPIVAGQLVEIEISEAEGKAVEEYISGQLEYPAGIESNPIGIEGDGFQATIEKASWFTVRHNGPVIVTGEGEFNVVYNGVTYAAVDGKVEFEAVMEGFFAPAPKFVIDAAGTYTFSLVVPVGTMDNPAELVMGSNTASLSAGAQGYFYTWTAAEEGTLKITMPAGDWSYQINNMTSFVYGDMQWSSSDPVVNPAEIAVAAGDEIQVIVNTYDPANQWENPAGDITFTAEFILPAPPVVEAAFTAQPADVNVVFGENAQFSVEFSITEGVTYEWQFLSADGTWKPTTVSGYNTNAITVPATGLNLDGRQYRCVVTCEGQQYTSEVATLTLTINKSEVTYQPSDVEVVAGQNATFSFGDSMSGASTYQWQWCKPGSANWANTGLPGYATTTLTVPAYEFRSGYQYRCRIENDGGIVYTEAATLHVAPVAIISQQPINARVETGEPAVFHVEAVGEGLTYQWLYCNAGSNNWMETKLTGYNTPTLTVTANNNGRMYKCRIRNAYYANNKYDNGVHAQVYTEVARLYLDAPVIVTSQPADVTAAAGETAKFTVSAKCDTTFTYQWQYSKDGGASWLNVNSYVGATTATVEVPATANNNGRMYRVKFVNKYGDVFYSEAGTLTVQ